MKHAGKVRKNSFCHIFEKLKKYIKKNGVGCHDAINIYDAPFYVVKWPF